MVVLVRMSQANELKLEIAKLEEEMKEKEGKLEAELGKGKERDVDGGVV